MSPPCQWTGWGYAVDMLHVQSRGQSISLAQGLTQPPNSRLIAVLQESVDAPTYSEMEVLSLVPRHLSGYVHCMFISKRKECLVKLATRMRIIIAVLLINIHRNCEQNA